MIMGNVQCGECGYVTWLLQQNDSFLARDRQDRQKEIKEREDERNKQTNKEKTVNTGEGSNAGSL